MSPRRGLALGCGGTLGAAWTVGALRAVEGGLDGDPRGAEAIVGTSAGAEYGGMLAAGVGVEAMLDAQREDPAALPWLVEHLATAPPLLPPLPRPLPTAPGLALRAAHGETPVLTGLAGLLPRGGDDGARMRRLGDRLAATGGWVEHDNFWAVAVDLTTGQRAAFGRSGAPRASLAEALHASWAIPGWIAPARIGDRRYFDGGAYSMASADLLADPALGLDQVIAIVPMASARSVRAPTAAGRVEMLLRRAMSRRLDAELATLHAAGIEVLRLDMGQADLAVAGANFNDDRRRRDVLEASLRSNRRASLPSL